MGGNALEQFGIKTRRLPAREYKSLVPLVVNQFEDQGWSTRVIQAYRNKLSFGDLDVLVVIRDGYDMRKFIQETFQPRKIFSNGGVHSFDFSDFQIDAISVQEAELEIAYTYFGWNDLGNLMGRIAHEFGVRYGHNGLWLILRETLLLGLEPKDTDHVARKVRLSVNPDEIFDYLGYDYERFLEGFDDLEDVYEYAVSTPYFNSAIYHLENRNHQARTRDRKRTTYTGFLDWLEANPEKDRGYEFRDRRHEYFEQHVQRWGIQNVVEEAIEELNRKQTIKDKFNGNLVMSWLPELAEDPKRLGAAIGRYKANPGFETFVLDATPEEVRGSFLAFMEA